jgi:hypothetical protein
MNREIIISLIENTIDSWYSKNVLFEHADYCKEQNKRTCIEYLDSLLKVSDEEWFFRKYEYRRLNFDFLFMYRFIQDEHAKADRDAKAKGEEILPSVHWKYCHLNQVELQIFIKSLTIEMVLDMRERLNLLDGMTETPENGISADIGPTKKNSPYD